MPKKKTLPPPDDFSSEFMEAPGDCSPSRKVVSKIAILRVILRSFLMSVLLTIEL